MTDQHRPAWSIRLQAERETRGWGPFEAARRLREAVGITDHPGNKVKSLAALIARHEKGQVFPADWAIAYASAYGIPEEELFPAPPPRRTAVPVGTVNTSPTPYQGDDDVKRRAALQLLTALGAGAAAPPGALDEVLSGIGHFTSSGAVDLDRWERAVWGYGHQQSTQPTEASLRELTADIINVGQLLNQPHRPAVSTGLLRVSAALSGLLAMHFDAIGDRRAARVTWGAATGTADVSGDRDLSVWVRAKEADGALWGGAPRPVVAALADEAIAIAKGNPSHGLARAYTVSADLWAEVVDVPKAHTSLNQLTETLDNLPDSVTADAIGHVGERFLGWHKGYIYTLIGDAKAVPALDKAIDQSPAGWYGTGSLNLMRAIGLVKEREINEGLEHAQQALHDGPITTATRNRLIGHILAAVPEQARELPAARELRALTSA